MEGEFSKEDDDNNDDINEAAEGEKEKKAKRWRAVARNDDRVEVPAVEKVTALIGKNTLRQWPQSEQDNHRHLPLSPIRLTLTRNLPKMIEQGSPQDDHLQRRHHRRPNKVTREEQQMR
ncbi:hypothetical protein M9H77_27229 [Catharanthus roseus]|uniref:Uncharacterized protein n=1 Tax=Catharanthus roseus TaxID=4058 RepID=A0ACC0ACF6_CATRO|nr:hypothetical protein M9H77_27229 [Catharanthus roseus]